jgi:RNA polymerase-binding transcription factor DksA
VQTNRLDVLAALSERKDRVSRTLRHLENQKRELQQSGHVMCAVTYQSRLTLLDELIASYQEEIGEIKRALHDPSYLTYRVCVDCCEPIGQDHLKENPDATRCLECDEHRSASGFRENRREY